MMGGFLRCFKLSRLVTGSLSMFTRLTGPQAALAGDSRFAQLAEGSKVRALVLNDNDSDSELTDVVDRYTIQDYPVRSRGPHVVPIRSQDFSRIFFCMSTLMSTPVGLVDDGDAYVVQVQHRPTNLHNPNNPEHGPPTSTATPPLHDYKRRSNTRIPENWLHNCEVLVGRDHPRCSESHTGPRGRA
jgi:hypothetical protein